MGQACERCLGGDEQRYVYYNDNPVVVQQQPNMAYPQQGGVVYNQPPVAQCVQPGAGVNVISQQPYYNPQPAMIPATMGPTMAPPMIGGGMIGGGGMGGGGMFGPTVTEVDVSRDIFGNQREVGGDSFGNEFSS